MMIRLLMASAAFLLLSSTAWSKDLVLVPAGPVIHTGPTGQPVKIRICRRYGLVGMLDHKTVPIPAGSSFTTSGYNSDFVVSTTKAVTLGVKPACAIAPAKVTENLGHKNITPATTGKLVAQFSTPGADLEARIVQ